MAILKDIPPRLFLDSGVLIEGLLSTWSVSRSLLILARCSACRVVLAEDVRAEVEDNLTDLLADTPQAANEAIEEYAAMLRLLKPETVGLTTTDEVARHRHLIRHAADVPVLVAALKARPNWLVTTNTRHFTSEVAHRTGLAICTPLQVVERIRILGERVGS